MIEGAGKAERSLREVVCTVRVRVKVRGGGKFGVGNIRADLK